MNRYPQTLNPRLQTKEKNSKESAGQGHLGGMMLGSGLLHVYVHSCQHLHEEDLPKGSKVPIWEFPKIGDPAVLT